MPQSKSRPLESFFPKAARQEPSVDSFDVVPPEPSTPNAHTEVPRAEGNETRSPQPQPASTIGSIAESDHVAIPTDATPAAGESHAVNYYDQPGAPLPSTPTYNIVVTKEARRKWYAYCRSHAWRSGKKSGNPELHRFPRGLAEVRCLLLMGLTQSNPHARPYPRMLFRAGSNLS